MISLSAKSRSGPRVFAIDATVLSAADTPANDKAFGRHMASRGRSAFPQLRLVTLTSVATHEVRAAGWSPYGVHETVVARLGVRCLARN